MTDTPAPARAAARHHQPRDTQLIVSLSIVGAMAALGVTLVIAAVVMKDMGLATGGVSTIIGSLATALNTPTGVSNALKAVKPADPGQ